MNERTAKKQIHEFFLFSQSDGLYGDQCLFHLNPIPDIFSCLATFINFQLQIFSVSNSCVCVKASHATPAIVVAERFSRTNIFCSDNRSATAFAEVASKALRECACGPSVVWFKPKINFISRRFWHSVVATFAELGKNRRQQTKLLYYVLKGLLHTEKLFHFVCGI